MPAPRIGFLGFGEVAAVFSARLCQFGATVAAYDIVLEQPNGRGVLGRRRRDEGVCFLSLAELVAGSDYILATVTTQTAVAAARACRAHLRAGQVYLDLNATAPAVKRELDAIVQPTGAVFVEGAILGAVGVSGADTRILIGGEKGGETAAALAVLGLNTVFYNTEIGKASTFKLLRSVFSKGLEALLIEFLLAGKQAGIGDELWREVVDLFDQNRFEQIAENWVRSHPVACERRYHEIVQVAELLRAMGLEPVMSAAAEDFFRRSLAAGIDGLFTSKPDNLDEAVQAIEHALRRRRGI